MKKNTDIKDKKTVVRFAPAPSGFIHAGNARSAIMNYILAATFTENGEKFVNNNENSSFENEKLVENNKKELKNYELESSELNNELNKVKKLNSDKSEFILRIDDTNESKVNEDAKRELIIDLNWLGIFPNNTYTQSERCDLYSFVFDLLRKYDFVYPCRDENSSKNEGSEKKNSGNRARRASEEVDITKDMNVDEKINATPGLGMNDGFAWRFELKNFTSAWYDMVIGEQRHDAIKMSSDPVIVRKNGSFTYMFASAVDDIFMGLTHVIRGKDHVSNTAVQIQIMKAILYVLKSVLKRNTSHGGKVDHIGKFQTFDVLTRLFSFSDASGDEFFCDTYSRDAFSDEFTSSEMSSHNKFSSSDFSYIKFGHLPLLAFEDGRKFSKRNNSMNIRSMRSDGFLPMAINNYLMSLGTNCMLEFNSMNDMLRHFANVDFMEFLSDIGKGTAVFSMQNLLSINKKLIFDMSLDDVLDHIDCMLDCMSNISQKNLNMVKNNMNENMWSLIRENSSTLIDVVNWVKVFCDDSLSYENMKNHEVFSMSNGEIYANNTGIKERSAVRFDAYWSEFFTFLERGVKSIHENYHTSDVHKKKNVNSDVNDRFVNWNDEWNELAQYMKKMTNRKGKDLYMPIRIALTGMEHGPKMNEMLQFMDGSVVLKRIKSWIFEACE